MRSQVVGQDGSD